MTFSERLERVLNGESLTQSEMRDQMMTIMTGGATDAQIGAFLAALRAKGESVEEITGGALVMRELSAKVDLPTQGLVDTCGTGGDGAGLFNVSTASALVVAAAGGRVAKHGNRSVSSTTGSADLLEHAGVTLGLGSEAVVRCVEELGVGFMFAPAHHSAMKHAIGPRKEMGVRTLFNLLGPLTNPAGAPNQVLGVFAEAWVEPMAQVLHRLGSERVMVVHSNDGLDEISCAANTEVAELKNGAISRWTLKPSDYGLEAPLTGLTVDNVAQSYALIEQALTGQSGGARSIVALNAGAALYVSGVCMTYADGVARALEVQDSGQAWARLAQLAELTQGLKA